jgi:hypothetical protein
MGYGRGGCIIGAAHRPCPKESCERTGVTREVWATTGRSKGLRYINLGKQGVSKIARRVAPEGFPGSENDLAQVTFPAGTTQGVASMATDA